MRRFMRFFLVSLAFALVLSGTLAIVPEMLEAPKSRASGHSVSVATVLELIAAIEDANGGGPSVIVLTEDNYELTVADNTDFGPSGLPVIAADIAIQGNGATIQRSDAVGTPSFRIFAVEAGGDLLLEGVTVRNGVASGASSGSFGGGIYNAGSLQVLDSTVAANFVTTEFGVGAGIYSSGTATLTDSIVSGNIAENGHGGGVFNHDASLTMSNSLVENNHARGGGGLYSTGINASANLTNSMVTDNSATSGNGGGINNNTGSEMILANSTIHANSAAELGGGIENHRATLSLFDSVVSDNEATSGGGIRTSFGIFDGHHKGALTLTNSTVSGNQSSASGGGIFKMTGALTVTNSTISDNTSGNNGGGIWIGDLATLINSTIAGNEAANNGGGIYVVTETTFVVLHMTNMLVAGNTATGSGPAVIGPDVKNNAPADGVFNLIGDGTGTTGIVDGEDGNLVGDSDNPIIPLIGPLQDNGGPTETRALLTGSPAINAADAGACLSVGVNDVDQRGELRNAAARDACDIGAYDTGLQANEPPVADSQSVATDQNTPVGITLTGSDPDDDPLLFSYTQPNNGVVTGAGPAVTYTPDQGFSGQDSFTFTVNDGEFESAPATISIEVLPVNSTPVVTQPDDQNAVEGSSTPFDLGSFTDPDDDFWTVSVDWGDGSSSSLQVLSEGPLGSLPHMYDDNGVYTVTVTVTDADDESGSAAFQVEVHNVAPTASFSAPDTANEGDLVSLELTGAFDPSEADTLAGFTYSFDCGDGAGYGAFASSSSVICPVFDNETRTVGGKIRDKDGGESEYTANVEVINVAPFVGEISAPVDPVAVNTTVEISAGFTDPGALDTHTAQIDWGDGAASAGIVTQDAGFGSVVGSHSYSEAGVYTVTLTVTDNDGGAGHAVSQYIVVYDPNAGFVTGGGWIDSPAGAYKPDLSLTGKANFGFVSRYQRGANVPTGNTQFRFRAGDVNFHSSSYAWLVITGNDVARFKGQGAINGAVAPNGQAYQFMIWAGDANPDTFRIKIWWESNGSEVVVYDNGINQPTGGGSIVIHNK